LLLFDEVNILLIVAIEDFFEHVVFEIRLVKMVQHAGNSVEAWSGLVVRWVQIFDLSHDLHLLNLLDPAFLNELFENDPWSIVWSEVLNLVSPHHRSGKGSSVDGHLISASDQIVSVLEHMDEWLDGKAVVRHLTGSKIELLDVKDEY